ncbi:MAG: DEAD/DEAH box helicase [Candidatus Methanoperedens sp.]|nr:DEAD/DEAH box helicase [Candidatus Methanoperedens sp.]MCE8425653.1 DEAD/DEAH box helicase [Candidatus Methanoperedens sp.]MCE8428482.1 DEAD/DEAH box helicase [Candidatus Methanoperedens sp.]
MLSVIVFPQDSKLAILPIKDNSNIPIFQGTLILKKTPRGARTGKFRIRKGDQEEFRAPQELIELLRLADEILIAEGNERTEAGFKELLEAYQLDYGYTATCHLCLISGKYSITKSNYIEFHGRRICEDCAKNELVREMKNFKLGRHGQERLFQILVKHRNLDRVLAMLSPEKLDSGLTRFDTIQASRTGRTIKVKDLAIHPDFKKLLLPQLEQLMPVQTLSVEGGLFEGKNQLIVSATATGKTLIGELAGINNLLNGKGKMLFLVPLVALANQKYEQFTKRYSSIAKTSLRIGTSRITKKVKGIQTSLSSDIITGTYEGVDFILRSGNSKTLGKIGTVVIDEIHTLEDAERGHRLDGLIARLKFISPQTQFIYLSATVGKPDWLAQKLGAGLIEFEERPVPIERHLLFAPEYEKKRLIERLSRQEYNKISSKGFRGQTIVFTNSRRGCHLLADGLSIKAMPYHAGLSFSERKKVEEMFGKGELPVVVTTAALAAGVDFPSSQVIFDSLAMGIEWLTIREFQQMLGRAGRPDYHDLGIVVLLADPEKRFGKGESEDEIAFRLLRGELEHFGVDYGEDELLEETLSNIVLSAKLSDIKKIDGYLLGKGDLEYLFDKLKKYGFIEKRNGDLHPTDLGRIVASHFLSVEHTFLIKNAILKGREPLDILTELETMDSVYFKYAAQLSDALGTDIPTRVFGAGLDIVFSSEGFSKLKENLRRNMLDFAKDFMACRCKDSPYCGCAQKKFSKGVIELCAQGLMPDGIISQITKQYGVYAYAGDVLNYLDRTARTLEAVELISRICGKNDASIKARELREKMEA